MDKYLQNLAAQGGLLERLDNCLDSRRRMRDVWVVLHAAAAASGNPVYEELADAVKGGGDLVNLEIDGIIAQISFMYGTTDRTRDINP